ncbi:MAG TPA: ATP-binding domain-containing protein [Mycobacteriales bacterium]|nr:ATP-binding domain-containing protein [Mycobacteriales bacterium]
MRESEPDDPLEPERRHLQHARRCLELMRDAVRSLDAQGGDPVSTEYLKAELFRRVQALLDDPTTPLFFGRIDRTDTRERFYIGRRHVRDQAGEPVVVDWRADISRAFYRASARSPMNVGLRRRFGFQAGVMTSLEDEHLDLGEDIDPSTSGILTAEIERPRVGPMRDIVATIQPDQDDLVRTDLATSVCIQGAPGTGKTAVGLHRAAYLLYAHREQLKRTGVLVIGPNRSFLGYIGALLPALGEIDVEQVTVADLAPVTARGQDDAVVERLKGDIRMAEVVRRAVYSGVRMPDDDALIAVNGRRWRISRVKIAEIVRQEVAAGTPYDVSRARLGTLLAEVVRRRIEAAGGSPDDRAVARIARSEDVRGLVDHFWPKVSPTAVVEQLLTDATFLARHADSVLDDGEQSMLLRTPTPRWTPAEAFLVDEARGLLTRPPSFGHVVVDEAQDLSAMQCRAVARRCPTGSLTILGDLAQATAPAAVADWSTTLQLLEHGDATIVPLTRGYRVPGQVLDFANGLLPSLEVDVAAATSVRRGSDALQLVATDDVAESVSVSVSRLLHREGSIGVIGRDDMMKVLGKDLQRHGLTSQLVERGMNERVTLVPVTLCKGLEFDHVVVVEPAAIVQLARGFNWLYVALTRAVTTLTVVHSAPLPVQLRRRDVVDSEHAVRG